MKIATLKWLPVLLLALSLQNSSYALKPAKEYFAIPDTMCLPFEKNTIITPDGMKLNSWSLLPAKGLDKKITLVVATADAGNMSGYLSQAAILSQVGYTVVLFDYRGFGQSSAFTINKDMLYYNEFATDLTAAVKFAKAKYPKNKTGIWSFSMGTIITTLANKNAQPDFIIGDSYVTDPLKIKEHYAIEKKPIDLPANYAAYNKVLSGIKTPMLVFSGTDDKVTTPAAIDELKKQKPAINVVSYNGGHMHGFIVLSKEFFGSEYVAEINKFLRVE